MPSPKSPDRGRKRIYLLEWRKYRNKTQEQLAGAVGVSKVHVSNIERGQRQYTQQLLEAFADYLECEPWQILNVDPLAPGSIWSIWESVRDMSPEQQEQAVAVLKALAGPRPEKKKRA